MGGGFDQAAVAARCPTARRDAAVGTRRFVCPEDDLAAVAMGDGVGVDRRIRAHVGRGGVLYRRVLALIVAANQHRAAACVARSIDAGAKEADVVAGDRDAAAGLPCGRAGHVQRARHTHRPALHVTQQANGAVAVFKRLRLNHAGIVDRASQQAASRLRGEQHLASVGPDQAAILDKRIHGTLVHGDVEQSVPGQIKCDGLAGGECHRAEFGGDYAFVADVGT